jgi:PIN domain nuclease of toxin-antitoxin system
LEGAASDEPPQGQASVKAALLDTHALIWWVDDPRRLSVRQRRAIRTAGDAGELWVSEISFWEVASLVERGRLRLAADLDDWLERAAAEPLVQRCGISPAIARELVALTGTRDWDPADRILVATARVLGAKLVTSDDRIVDARLVETV